MKVFARKERESLSVIPLHARRREVDSEGSSSLKDSFNVWLHSVRSTNHGSRFAIAEASRVPRLTVQDVTRVNQATIREGESHCIWPPSVVRQFQKAHVITEAKAKHYVLNDVNLTPVR